MRLNEKNQCPKCKVKPLTYKRIGGPHHFCVRCGRSFSLETGVMIENRAWTADGISKYAWDNSFLEYMDTLGITRMVSVNWLHENPVDYHSDPVQKAKDMAIAKGVAHA